MLSLPPHTFSEYTDRTIPYNSNLLRLVIKQHFAILLLFFSTFLSAQPFDFDTSIDSVYTKADQMPFFEGCELETVTLESKKSCSELRMSQFIAEHLIYPDKAKYNGIEGTVYVSFIIDKTGHVQKPKVLVDIGGGCGEAALQVIKAMPKWEAALHKNQPVHVKMNLPIQFYLRDDSKDEAEPFNLSWGGLQSKQVTKEQLIDNLESKLYVRDSEGTMRYVDQIEFLFEKENRQISASSRGEMSDELKKVVDRVKKGGTFSVYASVQENGRFITISRSFLVVK